MVFLFADVRRLPHCLCLILAVVALVQSGCGKSDQLETAAVSGTVTLDGKPLSDGTVTFLPEQGKMATGAIQSDGSFCLSTYRPGDGAIVGTCHASVTILLNTGEENELKPAQRSPIPLKYTSPSTSGLKFDIESGQDHHFNVSLRTN